MKRSSLYINANVNIKAIQNICKEWSDNWEFDYESLNSTEQQFALMSLLSNINELSDCFGSLKFIKSELEKLNIQPIGVKLETMDN